MVGWQAPQDMGNNKMVLALEGTSSIGGAHDKYHPEHLGDLDHSVTRSNTSGPTVIYFEDVMSSVAFLNVANDLKP